MADIRIGLLGPLTIDGTPGAALIPTQKERAMFAALARRPGQVVQRATLIEDLWEDTLPKDPAATLRTYAMRLRRNLAPDGPEIRTCPSGYRLSILTSETDVSVFEQSLRAVPALILAREWELISRRMTDADALWRCAVPLTDIPSCPLKDRWSAALEEQRLLAITYRLVADIHLGLCRSVIPELASLAAEHPLDESVAALQMRALYRADRQADAIETYRTIRGRLATHLGVDPSDTLKTLYLQIISHDPGLLE